jgi:hypothetical protein
MHVFPAANLRNYRTYFHYARYCGLNQKQCGKFAFRLNRFNVNPTSRTAQIEHHFLTGGIPYVETFPMEPDGSISCRNNLLLLSFILVFFHLHMLCFPSGSSSWRFAIKLFSAPVFLPLFLKWGPSQYPGCLISTNNSRILRINLIMVPILQLSVFPCFFVSTMNTYRKVG